MIFNLLLIVIFTLGLDLMHNFFQSTLTRNMLLDIQTRFYAVIIIVITYIHTHVQII